MPREDGQRDQNQMGTGFDSWRPVAVERTRIPAVHYTDRETVAREHVSVAFLVGAGVLTTIALMLLLHRLAPGPVGSGSQSPERTDSD